MNKNIYLLKLSYIFYKKKIKQNLYLSFIFFFIFIFIFCILSLYIVAKDFINSDIEQNIIIINKEIKDDTDIISFDTLNLLKEKTSDIATISYNYILRVPMYAYFFYGKSKLAESDIFLISYDFENLEKSKKYTTLNNVENNKDSIGLIISNKSLGLIKDFVFNGLDKNSLFYINGNIEFGKSTFIHNSIGKKINKKFYIKGISDDLPIYAIAIDHKDSDNIITNLGLEKKAFKIYEINILLKSKDYIDILYNKFKNIENIRGSKLKYYDLNKELFETKDKYNKIINYIGIPIMIFFLLILNVIFFLNLKLSIQKNINNIKIFKYLKFSGNDISKILFFEFLIVILISYFFINIFLISIYKYIYEFYIFMQTYINITINFSLIFINFTFLFLIVISLFFIYTIYYINKILKNIQ